jgi:AcrR family transcriptional regulator
LLCTLARLLPRPDMPAPGDHDARKAEVSEAVWRVLATHGVGGLTLRAVAAQLDATTGLVSHYFPTKRALLHHARDLAEERTTNRPRLPTPNALGIESLRGALLDVLPLSAEMVDMSRTWVSFWGAAIADVGLGANERLRYARWRSTLRGHVVAAQAERDLTRSMTPDELVMIVASFAHGLVVQSLFDETLFTPRKQAQLVDRFLAALR